MTAPKKGSKPTLPKRSQLTDPMDTVRKSEDGYNVKVKYGEFIEAPVDKHGIELGHYVDELDRKGMILPKRAKKDK